MKEEVRSAVSTIVCSMLCPAARHASVSTGELSVGRSRLVARGVVLLPLPLSHFAGAGAGACADAGAGAGVDVDWRLVLGMDTPSDVHTRKACGRCCTSSRHDLRYVLLRLGLEHCS